MAGQQAPANVQKILQQPYKIIIFSRNKKKSICKELRNQTNEIGFFQTE
jgi:hypothetical protein